MFQPEAPPLHELQKSAETDLLTFLQRAQRVRRHQDYETKSKAGR